MNPGVTISGADGLPVELMDFSIEDEVASGAEGDSDVDAEGGVAARRAAAEAPREAAAP